MMFYSYLREPSLEETGYKQGYKAGSLSYLVDGDIILTDKQTHYDGQIDAAHKNEPGRDHNATFVHDQDLDFDGRKGISEFYAQGFFPSNRAVSAGKKIRYDDLDGYMLGPSTMSPKINVHASVGMGPAKETHKSNDYDFRYNAKVWDGTIDISDATSWTNKTGSRRVDWVQEASIKGKILNISNDLWVDSLFFPGGGAYEWLPCGICAGGAGVETFNGWPSEGTKYAVLTPPEKLPNLIREANCSPMTGCTIKSKGSLPVGTIGLESASVPQSIQSIPATGNIRNPRVTYVTRDINKPLAVGLMSKGG